jgi:hypothetical protein
LYHVPAKADGRTGAIAAIIHSSFVFILARKRSIIAPKQQPYLASREKTYMYLPISLGR